jgi:hypothetical protein
MTKPFLNLKPTRREPVFWIRRVVILERLDSFKVVNDIPFKRGLNIVFGEEKASPQQITASGHGVGKTSLCRLIRYCLGEQHFGRKRSVAAIRNDFPTGWVGAEVFIEGQLWSVLRPFSVGPWPRAGRNMSVEELAAQKQQDVPFDMFESALADAVMSRMPRKGQVVTGTSVTLAHLLPAFTRDQECRLESVWKWRSERSNSDSPSLPRPKVDGSRVIRAILGLLDLDEVRAQEDVDTETTRSTNLRPQIDDRLKEPQFWVTRLNKALVDQGVPDVAADAGALFSPQNRVAGYLGELRGQLKGVTEQLTTATAEREGLLVEINRLEQERARLVALQGLQKKKGDTAAQYTEDERNLLKELEALSKGVQSCRYANYPFRNCEHMATHLADLKGAKPVAPKVISNADQKMADLASAIKEIDQQLKAPRGRMTKLAGEIEQNTSKQRDLDRVIDAIERLEKEVDHYAGVIAGSERDEELDTLREQMNTSEDRLARFSATLETIRSRTSKQFQTMVGLYSTIISEAISPEYSGEIIISADEVEFEIRRKAAIGGEAVESLAVVLADICGLLASTEGAANHPGFLMHDSPREADLGAGLYHRVLSLMVRAHSVLGGDDNAPFQYIMTTTTPPPDDARPVIRLHLSDEDEAQLLFKRRLGIVASLNSDMETH